MVVGADWYGHGLVGALFAAVERVGVVIIFMYLR